MPFIRLGRRIASFFHDRRGNIAWIYALSFIPLTMAAAASVDVIAAFDAKTALQDAIDAATLAGANADNSATVGANVFASETAGKFAVNGTPSFVTNGDNSFTGTVTAKVPAQFLPLIGMDSLTIKVSATAMRGASSAVCILVVDKTASQALLLNSGADIEASKCEMDVATKGSPAVIFNSGSTLNTAKTCIAGTSIINNGGIHPNVSTGCSVAADPFAGQLPTPTTTAGSCNGGNYNGGSITLSPGVYCGWYNFNSAPNVTFQPGVYVIKGGGWNVNGGTWNGTGVTFYFADNSKIQFNSGVNANLSAPTSGTYSGLLMYEVSGLSTSQFIFDDSKGHKLSGLIYLPSRQMIMNAGANTTADAVTLVVDTLTVNNATWYVTPAPSQAIAGGGTRGSAYLVK